MPVAAAGATRNCFPVGPAARRKRGKCFPVGRTPGNVSPSRPRGNGSPSARQADGETFAHRSDVETFSPSQRRGNILSQGRRGNISQGRAKMFPRRTDVSRVGNVSPSVRRRKMFSRRTVSSTGKHFLQGRRGNILKFDRRGNIFGGRKLFPRRSNRR